MKTLFLALSLAFSLPATASTLEVDPNRTVSILGGVDAGIIKKANELLKLVKTSKEPVYLFINSPGGSVRAGEVFVSAMTIAKERGVIIKCVSTVHAASMAFSIYANCSERYALSGARLLFHPVSITVFMSRLTAKSVSELYDIMSKIDKDLQDFLVESMGIDREVMLKAYYEEKWWSPEELKSSTKDGWITIVKDVKGISDLFAVSDGNESQTRDFLRTLPEKP